MGRRLSVVWLPDDLHAVDHLLILQASRGRRLVDASDAIAVTLR